MIKFTKPWINGGTLTATYEGSGSGSAIFTSDVNEDVDRETRISFHDIDNSIVINKIVKQEGLREIFEASDGDFLLADDENLGVLKSSKRI